MSGRFYSRSRKSALPSKADIHSVKIDVGFVPKADMCVARLLGVLEQRSSSMRALGLRLSLSAFLAGTKRELKAFNRGALTETGVTDGP
jgi:hypothetical protein